MYAPHIIFIFISYCVCEKGVKQQLSGCDDSIFWQAWHWAALWKPKEMLADEELPLPVNPGRERLCLFHLESEESVLPWLLSVHTGWLINVATCTLFFSSSVKTVCVHIASIAVFECLLNLSPFESSVSDQIGNQSPRPMSARRKQKTSRRYKGRQEVCVNVRYVANSRERDSRSFSGNNSVLYRLSPLSPCITTDREKIAIYVQYNTHTLIYPHWTIDNPENHR